MIFRSYAQLYEDRILLHALRHVRQGCYIDVGAQHPRVASVTKLFYDRGWSGINIEPVPRWFDQLVAERPRDINIRVAAGATRGEVVLHEIPESGLSTVIARYAERHRQAGWSSHSTTVRATTLAEICREYIQGEIHFLKIDAEGSEAMVLEGCDFSRHRPWIVVIEATEPLTDIPAYMESEALLLAGCYEFVVTDGWNRYYIAREHRELKGPLATGVRRAKRRRQLANAFRRFALLPGLLRRIR